LANFFLGGSSLAFAFGTDFPGALRSIHSSVASPIAPLIAPDKGERGGVTGMHALGQRRAPSKLTHNLGSWAARNVAPHNQLAIALRVALALPGRVFLQREREWGGD
jgi:hypothetical protein